MVNNIYMIYMLFGVVQQLEVKLLKEYPGMHIVTLKTTISKDYQIWIA